MKKKLIIIICCMIICGCNIANTPTSKVEEYLGKYQRVDDDISLSYLQLSIDEDISDNNKKGYEKLIREQYMNLGYEIIEEKIDGDSATVTVEVKVTDYKEIFDKYDKNKYVSNIDEYHNLVIKGIKAQKDKVTYTIDFELNKNTNDEWILKQLSTKNRKKLLGIN